MWHPLPRPLLEYDVENFLCKGDYKDYKRAGRDLVEILFGNGSALNFCSREAKRGNTEAW